MTIASNLAAVRANIEAAAKKSGRDPKDIKLVAATKDVPVSMIAEAIKAGLTDIGENRVQEAKGKFAELKHLPVAWHMLGHLQTNKVKDALEMFSVIQSVDSIHLAQEISKRAGRSIQVLVEVNTSGEASKFGVSPESAVELARNVSELPNLKLAGLMTVGPLTRDEKRIRGAFGQLRRLYNEIKGLNLTAVELKYLSMGMSDDYGMAIEEGSNLVRIGRAIFGIEHKHTSV